MRAGIACGLRLTLSAALLLVVWRHTHWSVALALTWLAVVAEINGTLLATLMAWRREQQRKELLRLLRQLVQFGRTL